MSDNRYRVKCATTKSSCGRYHEFPNREFCPQIVTLLVDLLVSAPSTCSPEQFLALELILLHASGQDLADRVMGRLFQAESRESDPWAQDDYRVAAVTVLYAALGYATPWEYAFWRYYGKTLPKALIEWAERDRRVQAELHRCEQLVAAASLPPKKPNHIIKKILAAVPRRMFGKGPQQ